MSTFQQVETATATQVVRFVSCCDGSEIFFRGSLGLLNGSVYTYIGAAPVSGAGGQLIPNQCYTFFQELTTETITYPGPPPTAVEFSISAGGCEDGDACAECDPQPLCECPEGFTYNGETGLCERETETVAEYSGTLLPIVAGSKNNFYCDSGLRLYPDISSLTWPILGNGTSNSNYTLNENNGAGAAVIPTANVENEAFGSDVSGCDTGQTGGRLNKAGIWATGFPNNQELSFEFCVDIPGLKEKQYLIGLAGDNYVRFYIDGSLAVDLNSPGSGVTTPFRHWHTFPVTLSPGIHTIKLSGLNFGGAASFAAEIYDITLTEFQANLLYPAVGSGNCGSTEAQLEPYIIFSTRDYIGQSVPDPTNPGVWSCPGGETVDFCNGIPVCKLLETVPLACDCYLIIPCDGTDTFTSIDQSYADYVNTFVEVSGPEYTGCAYVVQTEEGYCNDTTATTVPTGVACDCTLRCWWVENSNGFSIVDENDEFLSISAVDAAPYIRICSKIPPVPEEGTNYDILSIIEIDDCETDGTCPDLCFKLTNCNTGEIIYSNSDVLFQYTFTGTNVVEILGRDGCWYVEKGDPERDPCDCIIDVTVIREYDKCEDCIKPVYYRLNSCDNNDVIYTQLNLEAFIDRVIKTNCGCFEVEIIDFIPPNINTQLIKLEGSYDTCIDCTRNYYELVDCQGIADPVYTYTDLSLYLGQVIKIENCTECWTVQEPLDPSAIYSNAGTVNVTESYADCDSCADDLVCTCSQVTNYSEKLVRTYQYLNCDNELVTISLGPNESSGRICLLKWIPDQYCTCFLVKLILGEATTVYTALATGNIVNGYPTYNLCKEPGDPLENCGIVSFDGTNWVIYDGNSGDPLYKLPESTSLTCPYGEWVNYEEPIGPVPTPNIVSYECPEICDCITGNLEVDGVVTTYTFTLVGYDELGNPVYQDESLNQIAWNGKTWLVTLGTVIFENFTLPGNCVTGQWISSDPQYTFTTEDCTVIPEFEFLSTDFFETFGECKYGVCPPRIFPNKRVITPGYNTPICTPEKYDMITCSFANIMYKHALEKRYGITNCCPEEDDKWIIKKELIDLQALRDPNYKCSECGCSCNSTNTCSTCNYGK